MSVRWAVRGRTRVRWGCTLLSALMLAVVRSPASTQAASWSPAPSLSTARAAHTATLLANGKVLVAGGGTGPFAATASAELYDPASSTWSPAASMTTARYLHAATTLRDGRVLVIGGSGDGSGWDASTESYDPASDTWTSTASRLGLPSAAHATTSLADGRVLVTGGVSDADPDATVELYDAVSGAWSSAERMTNGRDGHTATLLAGGDVLVTGGFTGGPTGWVLTASAELFTPPGCRDRTERWRGRPHHTAGRRTGVVADTANPSQGDAP